MSTKTTIRNNVLKRSILPYFTCNQPLMAIKSVYESQFNALSNVIFLFQVVSVQFQYG